MNPSLALGAAAVFASAVCAGIMASSRGNAMLAPAPLSTVRRERCFLVRNMAQGAPGVGTVGERAVVSVGGTPASRLRKASVANTWLTIEAKRYWFLAALRTLRRTTGMSR